MTKCKEKKTTKKKVDKVTDAYNEIMDISACDAESNIKNFISTLIPFVLTIVGSLEDKMQGKKISKKHRECMKMAKEMLVDSLFGAIFSGSTLNMFAIPLNVKSVWTERIGYDPYAYVNMKSREPIAYKKKSNQKKGKTK